MADEAVRWPDEIDEVLRGDLAAAAAYITPAGGAVVTSVCPMGIDRREAAEVGFTTSPGFPRKLERIIADPHVALAYHSREHGFSASRLFVLAQGIASVDIRPGFAFVGSSTCSRPAEIGVRPMTSPPAYL